MGGITDARFQGNPARMAHRAEVDRLVQEGLARFTTAELVEHLGAAGVAFGRVNSVEAFASHPQLRLTEVETPENGRVRLPASPVVWADGHASDEALRGAPRRRPE